MASEEEQNLRIAELMAITQLDFDTARNMLVSHNWDVLSSINSVYGAGTGSNSSSEEPERRSFPNRDHVATASSSSAPAPKPSVNRSSKRFATFADLQSSAREQSPFSGSDDGSPDNFFTGGEKSGLAVQNPDQDGSNSGIGGGSGFPGALQSSGVSGRLINEIFRQARQRQAAGGAGGHHRGPHADDDDSSAEENDSQDAFVGDGYTLGSSEVPSRPIRGVGTSSSSSQAGGDLPHGKRPGKQTRKLIFWKNGFSVGEDGPLYRYDDPANISHLEAIQSGRAPLSLLNVEDGQDVDVDIFRKDEDYNPPKRPASGFHGQGMRLGSPVPGEASTSHASGSASVSASVSGSGSATNDSQAAPNGLGSSGDAAVQLRLANGQARRLRFDSSGPVQQLYDYVDSQSSDDRAYVLQTVMPRKELDNKSQMLKDAGVAGSVVVQRWT